MSPSELKTALRALHLSGEKLAAELGISKQAVSAWRSGKKPIPAARAAQIEALLMKGAPQVDFAYTVDPAEIECELEPTPPVTITEVDFEPAGANDLVAAFNKVLAVIPRACPGLDPGASQSVPAPPTVSAPSRHPEIIPPAARMPAIFRRAPVPARAPRTIEEPAPYTIRGVALGPPPIPFGGRPYGPRCSYPYVGPGEDPRGCQQICAPGLPVCAEHFVRSVAMRQRQG